jgi:hypothetical protein
LRAKSAIPSIFSSNGRAKIRCEKAGTRHVLADVARDASGSAAPYDQALPQE